MTYQELQQLEKLLIQFGSYIGHRYCIAYPVIQDGFMIAIYDDDGTILQSRSSYDLISTAEKLTNENIKEDPHRRKI